MHDVDGSQL